jgi:sodium transport system permease protein
VGAVLRRELRDILRDRRTLFATFVLPVVLYPALLLGFGALHKSERESIAKVSFRVAATLDGKPFERPRDSAPRADDDPLVSEMLISGRFTFDGGFRSDDPVSSGEAHLAIELPSYLEPRLDRRDAVEMYPRFRSHDPVSKAAMEEFREAVRRVRDRYAPLAVVEIDYSSERERGGAAFGGVMAFIVVVMALLGAFTPAVDMVAGEKERGTLEALLTSPASRREIVFGKYGAVLACAVASSLANLGSLALTFQGLRGLISPGAAVGGGAFSVAFDVGGFLVVLVALAVVSALFGAAALSLSALARTYKEGMAYLTPLYMVVLPLAMIGMIPSAKLESAFLVPVANVALLMKSAMAGEPLGYYALATCLSLVVCALLSLELTIALFNREDVLFRDGKATFSLRRRDAADRASAPGPGLALFAVLLAIAASFYFTTPFMADGRVLEGLTLQFALFAAIPLALAALAQLRMRDVFGFRAPRFLAWIGAPVAALGGAMAALGALVLFGFDRGGESAENLQEIMQPLLERSPLALFFCVAFLPAFAEEILFRGFVLPGLATVMRPGPAVFVTAAVFAAAHLDPGRLPSTFVLGVVLGFLRLRTGSLWPAVLMHLLVNGAVVGLTVAAGAAASGDPGAADAEGIDLEAALRDGGTLVFAGSAALVCIGSVIAWLGVRVGAKRPDS